MWPILYRDSLSFSLVFFFDGSSVSHKPAKYHCGRIDQHALQIGSDFGKSHPDPNNSRTRADLGQHALAYLNHFRQSTG